MCGAISGLGSQAGGRARCGETLPPGLCLAGVARAWGHAGSQTGGSRGSGRARLATNSGVEWVAIAPGPRGAPGEVEPLQVGRWAGWGPSCPTAAAALQGGSPELQSIQRPVQPLPCMACSWASGQKASSSLRYISRTPTNGSCAGSSPPPAGASPPLHPQGRCPPTGGRVGGWGLPPAQVVIRALVSPGSRPEV